jgi:hypothetical protein
MSPQDLLTSLIRITGFWLLLLAAWYFWAGIETLITRYEYDYPTQTWWLMGAPVFVLAIALLLFGGSIARLILRVGKW